MGRFLLTVSYKHHLLPFVKAWRVIGIGVCINRLRWMFVWARTEMIILFSKAENVEFKYLIDFTLRRNSRRIYVQNHIEFYCVRKTFIRNILFEVREQSVFIFAYSNCNSSKILFLSTSLYLLYLPFLPTLKNSQTPRFLYIFISFQDKDMTK